MNDKHQQVMNQEGLTHEERLKNAAGTEEVLQRTMPLSRQLYKYVGFIATK